MHRLRAPMRLFAPLVVSAIALLGACTGRVGGSAGGGAGDDQTSSGNNGGGGNGNSSASGGASATSGAGGTVNAASCTVGPVASVPLRRLSNVELNNTLRDLFPSVTLATETLTADPAEYGFENRSALLNPSEIKISDFNHVAVDVAVTVSKQISTILPCQPTTGMEAACGLQFINTFGQRAFRRPLTADESKRYDDFFETERPTLGFNVAAQLVVEGMLQSVNFLYRPELGVSTTANGRTLLAPYELASRLSYLLWGSMPDAPLFDAAKSGKLATASDLETQAQRMLADPKARAALIDFHRQWLSFDLIDTVFQKEGAKDPTLYPTYTADMRAAIREESDRFTGAVMFDGDGTLSSLLTSTDTYVNATLAGLYGVAAPASGWGKVTLKSTERAGILTRANFLASHAHALAGSPPLRAVAIMDSLLCLPRLTPPADADLSPPKSAPGMPQTNRQLFEARTMPARCQACHGLIIDKMGFPFEIYDAVGGHRTTDNGFPVDPSGFFKTSPDADPVPVTDALDLSQKLAASPDVEACMTKQWFQFAYGRDAVDGDACVISKLAQGLADAKGDVRQLLVAIVTSDDFLYRPATP